jgi:23S rRNA (adenine-N6)-dimethyltransferase
VRGDARTRWGWHELAERWARQIVDDAGIAPGDLVLDIGAGIGGLTAPLVAAGARVVAVELHPVRVRVLRRRFADAGVVVVQADASDLRLPRRPFRVVANPPFALTTALLKRILQQGSALESAHVVVPRHVARRWVGLHAPGAHRWQRVYAPSIGRAVPARAFRPPATQPVQVLHLRRRGAPAVRGERAGS